MKTAFFLLASVLASLPSCKTRAGQAATRVEPAATECGASSQPSHSDGAKARPRPILPAHLFM